MVKSIQVSETTWKRLSELKLKQNRKTLEDVIVSLLERKP